MTLSQVVIRSYYLCCSIVGYWHNDSFWRHIHLVALLPLTSRWYKMGLVLLGEVSLFTPLPLGLSWPCMGKADPAYIRAKILQRSEFVTCFLYSEGNNCRIFLCLCRYNKHHTRFVILVEYAYVSRDHFSDFPKWSKHSVITPLIYFCAKNREWVNCSRCSSGQGTEEVSWCLWALHLPFSPLPFKSLSSPIAASR